MAGGYSELPNERVSAANGVDYAYRDTAGDGQSGDGLPLVLLQHFRGNLDNWDPALIDALATARRVVTFDNAGVGGSDGTTPGTIEQMARDALAFLAAMGFSQVDLLGFSIGSFVAQQITLTRPNLVAGGSGLLGAEGGGMTVGAGGHRRDRDPVHQPGTIPGRVLHPVRGEPASRPASAAAHLLPDRGPGHGHDLGDPGGAV